MCESLVKEFELISQSLNDKEKSYIKNADIFCIKYNYPGRDFYLWKETPTAKMYRKDKYTAYCDGVLSTTCDVKTNNKEIKVYIKNQ